MAGEKPARLYYILAPAYHGAGTLSWRLNAHYDVFAPGSTNPPRGEDPQCSCGEQVSTCPFWTQARDAIEISEDDPIPNMLPQAPFLTENKALNTLFNTVLCWMAHVLTSRVWKFVYEAVERFYGLHEKFLASCQAWTPHAAFVDGERSNLKFMAMTSTGFPVAGVIHLVRDPRSYAGVWKKFYPENSVEKATLEWAAVHGRIRKLATLYSGTPFLTVHYEDLMEKPVETFEKITAFMKVKPLDHPPSAPFDRTNHVIGLGTQDRTNFTPQPENAAESLTSAEKDRVLRVAGPLFSEFGYKSENIP